VCISLVQSYSTIVAVLIVLVVNLLSVAVEYAAIARVYRSVPALAMKTSSMETQELNVPLLGDDQAGSEAPTLDGKIKNTLATAIRPWIRYCTSPVFLASFSLSILYLTVLSTGVQYQTYMLSLGFSALSVSLLRLAAVVSELMATCLAPILTRRIGTVRCGLWSINWQVAWLVVAILAFEHFNGAGRAAGAALTVGIVMSRLGLWGFDLAVQDIVQEVSLAPLWSLSSGDSNPHLPTETNYHGYIDHAPAPPRRVLRQRGRAPESVRDALVRGDDRLPATASVPLPRVDQFRCRRAVGVLFRGIRSQEARPFAACV
jgi:hypothetical protein